MSHHGIDRDDEIETGDESGGIGESIFGALELLCVRRELGGVALKAEEHGAVDCGERRQEGRGDRADAVLRMSGVAAPAQPNTESLMWRRRGREVEAWPRDGRGCCSEQGRETQHGDMRVELEGEVAAGADVDAGEERRILKEWKQARLNFEDDGGGALSHQGKIAEELDGVAESLFSPDQDTHRGYAIPDGLRIGSGFRDTGGKAPLVFLPAFRPSAGGEQSERVIPVKLGILRRQRQRLLIDVESLGQSTLKP
jgi:hypothetical protein